MRNPTTNLHKIGYRAVDAAIMSTSFPGLKLFWLAMEHMGLLAVIDSVMVRPGNRGHSRSWVAGKLMAMLHAGYDRVSDIKKLAEDYMVSEGLPLPGVSSCFLLLQKMGEDLYTMDRLLDETCPLALRCLPKKRVLILDIDEFFIECTKDFAGHHYHGPRGVWVSVVIEATSGVVLAIRLNEGPYRPGMGCAELLAAALRRTGGRRVKCVRADAAYDHSETKNWCVGEGIGFVNRTVNRHGVLWGLARGVPKHRWRDSGLGDGSKLARVRHRPAGCKRWNFVVLQWYPDRKSKRVKPPAGFTGTMYGFATSLAICNAAVVRAYRMRGEHCENRIKELRSDLAGGVLPSGKLAVCRGWLLLNVLAHNVAKAMSKLMHKGSPPRMKRVRSLVYCFGQRLVKTARKTWFVLSRHQMAMMLRWEDCLLPLTGD